jgi:predicted ferric reductase
VLKAAMGITAMYLMIALTVSTYLIGRIGFRVWRVLHFAGFVAWLGATGHGIAAGSDTGELWARALYLGAMALVVCLVMARVVSRLLAASRAQRPVSAG